MTKFPQQVHSAWNVGNTAARTQPHGQGRLLLYCSAIEVLWREWRFVLPGWAGQPDTSYLLYALYPHLRIDYIISVLGSQSDRKSVILEIIFCPHIVFYLLYIARKNIKIYFVLWTTIFVDDFLMRYRNNLVRLIYSFTIYTSFIILVYYKTHLLKSVLKNQ